MKILIVDDEAAIRRMLGHLLRAKGHQVLEAQDAAQALAMTAAEKPDVILLDLKLPDRTGLEILPELARLAATASVIMMTAYGSIPSAVQSMREGAWDYITKPFDNDELLARLRRIEQLKGLREEVEELRAELEIRYGLNELVGSSPRMAEVFKTIHKVGPVDATVLIQGESGTGKELVARAIHRISPRRSGPFVAVNCGAIPESLVEDAFFGHVKGAYTDAGRDRSGFLERAHGGTLFLDEVAELPFESQASLLRVLQERSFTPIGQAQPVAADFRTICASNVALDQAVSDRRFREDLFWRLELITVHVPPLRERAEDIPALVDHLIEKWAAEMALPARQVEPSALETLLRYRWPGNVRELENTLGRALVMAEDRYIRVQDLPPRIRGGELGQPAAEATDEPELEELVRNVVDRFEAAAIRERLQRCGWNRTRTAESLGISRKTLFNKMQRYDISGAADHSRDTQTEDSVGE
jgi:two-component system response regulator AtoC